MVASIRVITKNETKIEFTPEDIAALEDMPGISLGHLVCKRYQLEKLFEFDEYPTQYKNGFIDRIFEIHYVSKLMLYAVNELDDDLEENFGKDLENRKIWSWIWHILKDEYKFNNYVLNIPTGEISIDIDNAASCNSN